MQIVINSQPLYTAEKNLFFKQSEQGDKVLLPSVKGAGAGFAQWQNNVNTSKQVWRYPSSLLRN